jgi:hypothetical protein
MFEYVSTVERFFILSAQIKKWCNAGGKTFEGCKSAAKKTCFIKSGVNACLPFQNEPFKQP